MGEAAETIPHGKVLSTEFKAHIWKPGQSGNPGGRSKSLASYIREKTLDGRQLVDFLLEVVATGGKFSRMSDRLKAVEILFDRGEFPKSPESKELKPVLNLSDFTEEELERLRAIQLGLAALRDSVGRRVAEKEIQ